MLQPEDGLAADTVGEEGGQQGSAGSADWEECERRRLRSWDNDRHAVCDVDSVGSQKAVPGATAGPSLQALSTACRAEPPASPTIAYKETPSWGWALCA